MFRFLKHLRHQLRSPYYRYRNARQIHTLRVTAAVLLSILVTVGLSLPHGFWATITVMIVMGGLQHHGDIRKKAGERALATGMGAALGWLVILQYHALGLPVLTYLLLALLAGGCAYFAVGKAGYVGLLTAITLFVVAGHGDNQISAGMWRTLEVVLGTGIALTFSFAYPLYAVYDWRFKLADNLRECARMYPRVMVGPAMSASEQIAALAPLNARLVQLRSLILPASHELHVPAARLEEIQRLHRVLLSTLETLAGSSVQRHASGEWGAPFVDVFTHHSRVQRLLLAMARSLRSGHVKHLQKILDDVDNIPQRPEPDGLPEALRGAYWLAQQLSVQLRPMAQLVAGLRHA